MAIEIIRGGQIISLSFALWNYFHTPGAINIEYHSFACYYISIYVFMLDIFTSVFEVFESWDMYLTDITYPGQCSY